MERCCQCAVKLQWSSEALAEQETFTFCTVSALQNVYRVYIYITNACSGFAPPGVPTV